jgi:signal transduction histidine kinase
MRLADFILGNTEAILAEWEVFARGTVAGATMDKLALRDHAAVILRATARDMMSAQTAAQQSAKSMGREDAGEESVRLDGASEEHGVGRVASGFDLAEVVSEYRALRASVIRLWRESGPDSDRRDLDDLTRFNESIDQSLTEAVLSYQRRINQSRQMFLAILGHDLRNPLNSMLMSGEALARSGQLDARLSRMASQISASAAAMGGMISDLLDFTSTGLGVAIPLAPAAMDLETLCREVVEETRAAHPECTLRFEAEGDLTGEWDATRLRQVVSNLLGNALQHGAQHCPVDLTVSGGHGEDMDVVLTVRNDGPPILPDAMARLFDPLVRGSASGQQRRAGSIGLGLYIAREVVTAHGGTIEVTSSVEDGTVFTVRLPRRGAGG